MKSNISDRECKECRESSQCSKCKESKECIKHDGTYDIKFVCYNPLCNSKRLVCKNCIKSHYGHTDDFIDDKQINKEIQEFKKKCKNMLDQLNCQLNILTNQYNKLMVQIQKKFDISIEILNGMEDEQFNQSINQFLIEDEQQQNLTSTLADGFKYFEDKIIQCQTDLQLKEFNKVNIEKEKKQEIQTQTQDQDQACMNKNSSSQQPKNNNHLSNQLESSTYEENQKQSYLFNDDQTVIQKNQSYRQTKDYNNDDHQSNQQLISNQKQISQQTKIRYKQNQAVNDQQSSIVKNQINNNDYQSQNQQEIQTQKQISLQAQQEIQYYVYEDLNNLIEVLADVKQTLKYFQNYMNHPYIILSLNRLIQQANLSNLIHFDCTQRYKNKDEEYFYQKEKENAKNLYYKLLNEMQLPKIEQINNCLSHYEQNFGKVNSYKQLPLYETGGDGEFNQKVVQQVFGGIQNVDQKKSQIKKGQYKIIGYDQIKNNIKQREIRMEGFLKQNFPFKK